MINREERETTRRTFLKAGGAAAAGLSLAGQARAAGKAEVLALKGGPKAVTAPVGDAMKWPQYGRDEEMAVLELVRNPNYGTIAPFEKAWAEYFKMPFVKAHTNGTSALTSMLFALDLPAGSEILVASYTTWFPWAGPRMFGIVPRFVDIDPRTLNISVEDCRKRLTKDVKGILAVDWFGVPCEMDALADFAREKGLILLEDCSHAHGASVQGKLIGTWGRMSAFSLQMGKPLPAIEGGMAMYYERSDFERAVTYGNYDLPKTFPEDSPYRKYDQTAFGGKLRIHPMSAALGHCQLKKLDEHNKRIVALNDGLNKRLEQLPGLAAQYARPDMQRVYYRDNILLIDERKAGLPRDAIVKALKAEGVSVSTFSWNVLHKYPFFREAQWWHHVPADPGDLTGSDEANRRAISIPIFTNAAPELIDQYVKAFEKVWAHREMLAKVG
ncbi:MAG TPA: DegT/DnrJ/EryC1/StrS family aminotransferase [Phycisphaerae bacterium]|nr:DegT/DnrJ/EryC1/StrS family aminotransferase [Phycisphaerae bacterium]HRY68721.1 DegT/DnrJ/EryC1/StrS family aminotransferase [Phycisphaerae bacterium]HSA29538.1 DegT/DnrJ/EryC1/StrS family aminotransferase [Phycisphaerae bacterium]